MAQRSTPQSPITQRITLDLSDHSFRRYVRQMHKIVQTNSVSIVNCSFEFAKLGNRLLGSPILSRFGKRVINGLTVVMLAMEVVMGAARSVMAAPPVPGPTARPRLDRAPSLPSPRSLN